MTTRPPRILVVDDEPDVEALIRQKFRHEIKAGSHDFLFAGDGIEALELIDRHAPIDVVLSDINMPRMDGLTLLSHLSRRPDSPATIIVSAYGDLRNIRAAMNAGAFDFVTKPIELDDLSVTLDKCLAHVDKLNTMSQEAARAQKTEALLSRYFSPAVIDSLKRNGARIEAQGERREATFVFTDLENFLPLVESSDPAQVVAVLNAYLDGITRQIFEHNGTVMKVIGDSVYAIFGAPLDDPDHAAAAVDCALAIDAFSQDFRARQQRSGLALGQTRIGVHTGWAIIGSFGGDKFFDYAAYGAAVNLASRLESANKALGTRVCVSQDTAGRIDGFRGRIIGDLALRGADAPLRCFEPVPAARMSDEALQTYDQAMQALHAGDAGARQKLAGLVARDPGDGLAAFHLGRLLSGQWQPLIRIDKAD
ncbi:adenylate/guanylate cyclase domain-containing protein [Tropicibacter oceani]|uniref:Adenylate/guanylate cyclase domain-containing protein n=1 Tax=Tropicibacter oceani TaxID=3058420 RepID=A0ABY8QNJ4_9RHOB|nr:adenylate/guanylate cyclase domain-containing protein [Tropicibacter oceani]WGW05687.1 adenylate/guanylate cyclase domain-containing protein [Tropicibacter oceani]